MPRIYTSASDPLDFCVACFPDLTEADQEYGNVGDGPDDRGNCFDHNSEHPPYEGEGYKCERCKKTLTGEDD